jgi:hypothetical protein
MSRKSLYKNVDELPDLVAKKEYQSVDELPDLKKKVGGVSATGSAEFGNPTKAIPSNGKAQSLSVEKVTPPQQSNNPFTTGGQYNNPQTDIEGLNLSGTTKPIDDAYIAPLTQRLKPLPTIQKVDKTLVKNNPNEIEIKEGIDLQKKHKQDIETAIENTAKNVLKMKGFDNKQGEEMFGSAVRNVLRKKYEGGSLTYEYDRKNEKPGLSRSIGWMEALSNSFNHSLIDEAEAATFDQMDTNQKVAYANKKLSEIKPTPFVSERNSGAADVAEMIGGTAPYLIKAGAAAATAAALTALAPETGGMSLTGLAPVLTVLFTAEDMINQGAKNEVMERYQKIKYENPNMDDFAAMRMAEGGGLSGKLQGAIQSVAYTTSLKLPIAKDSKNVLTNYVKNTASSALHLGGIMAGTKALSLVARNADGEEIPMDKAVKEVANTFSEGATAGAILTGLVQGFHVLPKLVKSAFKFSLKDTPIEEINTALKANEDIGRLPEGTAETVTRDIEGYNRALAKTDPNLSPETQASVAGLIQARDKMVEQSNKLDPTQRSGYDKNIEAINQKIKKITESNKPFEHEVDDITGDPIKDVKEDTKELPTLSEPIDSTNNKGIPLEENMGQPEDISQAVELNPTDTSKKVLTKDAEDLLASIGDGSKPAFVTKNLERIAKENGIEVTGKTTADDIINQLKEKNVSSTVNEGVKDFTINRLGTKGEENVFVVEDKMGNEVGRATLSKDGNYLENIRIDDKYRRKGLATKIYDYIEEKVGIELQPSPNKQSMEAKKLWEKRNLQKSVSKNVNGGVLANALGEAMSKAFNDAKNKQDVLSELENRYFEEKGLSKEDFNKLNEAEKAEIIKDAVKWKDDNPDLVKEVEKSLSNNKVETDKAVMNGSFGDKVEINNEEVKLPEKGFAIQDVNLKEGNKKGEGAGQEIYKKALDEHGVLYSFFPISEDALRVQDKLVEKGIAKVEIIKLPDGTEARKITKISNNKEADKVVEEVNNSFVKPKKPISEMDSVDLEEYANQVREYDKNLEERIFGKEGAKKYKEAQRAADSSIISEIDRKAAYKVIDDMEAALTETQRNELFGIGLDENGIYDHKEIRAIANRVSLIEEAENIHELSRALKNTILDFTKNPKNEGNLAAINAAKRRAAELGIDPKSLIEQSVKNIIKDLPDNNDKEFLATNIIEKLLNPAENKTNVNGEAKKEVPTNIIKEKGVEGDTVGNEPIPPKKGTDTKKPTTENIPSTESGVNTAEGEGGGKPPKEPIVDKEGGGRLGNKALANRLVNAKNIPEAAKKGIEAEGLEYEPQSQTEANDLAKTIIDEVGIDEAVAQAQMGKFGGDVNTLVQTEALNRLGDMSEKATNAEERLAHDLKFAEIGIALDKDLRKKGQGISAINQFYKKSPLGVQIIENVKRKADFDTWSKPKDKSWREFFEEMKKEPEFDAIVKEQVSEGMKQERAEARKARIKKVDDFFDSAKSKFKDSGAMYSTVIPPKLITAALDGMQKAYHAGEKVAKVIEDAVAYISKELGSASWDKDKFRKEWEEKLKDKSEKKPLSDEEVKAKILDRFRNKLKGLSDRQKEDVVRKSFQKIVESGGLDYADFRQIIADVTGRGEMTDAEAIKLKELVKQTNLIDEAQKRALTERTPEALAAFRKAELNAGIATRELNTLLYNRPNITKRLTSMMQLNTLGLAALVNNPIYNVWNQTTLRTPVGVVRTLVEKGIQGVYKAMGKEYLPEMDITSPKVQKEFFNKLGLGTREAVGQFLTGLNRMDYLQKEIHGQQIRPRTAMKDLWAYSKGEKNLTKTQVVDKLLQASPSGIAAEVVARVLNLGDKPQRFAAEGAQAAAFAKALGLKDIDYKLFIEFPREEAYRVYKAKGLSDAEAAKKADYIKDTIIKEGQRSTFQQDNMLNDVLTKVFGGEQSGLGSMAKSVVISPYIKIPSNAYWSYYNLINPEVALLQSMIYGGKAAAKKYGGVKRFIGDSEKTSAEKDLHEAKYWFAHAAVGIATRAVVVSLVSAGIFRPGNTQDDTKKEREGEQYYEPQGTINLSKLAAWMKGEDPSKVKNGLVLQNKWFGHWGTIGNAIARKNEDMTPEQKEKQDEFWNIAMGGLEMDALKDLNQGVFGNTSSLLSALNNNGNGLQAWGVNTVNMFANVIQPATYAQISRAELPYYTKRKADDFLGELKNSMLDRSSVVRKLTGQYPPSKVGIWGDKLDKKDNTIMRMFGISRTNDDNFAQPIYEDYKKTNNTKFFPPAVRPEIEDNGVTLKLPTKDAARLEELVGQQRRRLVAPYINDMATFEGENKTYSKLSNDEKTDNLRILYDEGFKNGKYLFLKENPKYIIPEKTKQQKQEDKKESADNKKLRESLKRKSPIPQ